MTNKTENEQMTEAEMLELNDNPLENQELQDQLEAPLEDLSDIPEEQILDD